MTEELTAIADDMTSLLPLFKDGGSYGFVLPSGHAARFNAMAIEAKSIIDANLNFANDYSLSLMRILSDTRLGFSLGPSYASIQEAAELARGAVRAINRKRATPPISATSVKSYIDPSRVIALQQISGGDWDFLRLAEMCRELNIAAANRCYMTTAMLVRAIIDHIPPVFGLEKFSEVANNYGGAKEKSFKGSMKHLQESMRHIADRHLHTQIRKSEDIPSETQVNFSADLDVLLGEVIRISAKQP